MRGRGRAGAVLAALTSALLLGAAGCGGPQDPGTPVPTFLPPPGTSAAAGGEGRPADGSIPTDCAGMLPADDLNALLGLPLGSVGVRSTIGVPEPSVGRTERVACRYAGTADGQGTLLDLNVARYTDADAAERQWATNTGVESGERRDVPLGAAKAALFERARETVLMVTYDDDTITLVLPEGPRPAGATRADVVVDLALRVLPTVGPPRTAAPDVPPPTSSAPAGPAVAAG